jgi:hypothetical protein
MTVSFFGFLEGFPTVELLVRFDPCKEKHNVFIIKVEGERS